MGEEIKEEFESLYEVQTASKAALHGLRSGGKTNSLIMSHIDEICRRYTISWRKMFSRWMDNG